VLLQAGIDVGDIQSERRPSRRPNGHSAFSVPVELADRRPLRRAGGAVLPLHLHRRRSVFAGDAGERQR